jgi:hypothetical protein
VPAGPPSFYFLEEAGPQYGNGTPDLNVGTFGFPTGLFDVETTAYPFDSRLLGEENAGQLARTEQVPTGGAPAVVPGQEAAIHPQRVETAPSPAIAGVGPG